MARTGFRVPATLDRALRGLARAVAGLARAMRRRHILGQLGALDDHMLADLGLTRADVMSAMAEPLYRDPTEQLARRAGEARRARHEMAAERRALISGGKRRVA